MLFDRTEAGYMEKKIMDNVPSSKIAVVDEVIEHTEKDDTSNHEVSVIYLDEPNAESRTIPLIQPRNNSAHLPVEGDFVLVEHLDSRENFPVATGGVHTFSEKAPLAKAGMSRHKYGNLYMEAYAPSDGSGGLLGQWVRLSKKSSDDQTSDDADAVIEIDDREPNGAITRMKGENGSVTIDDTGSKTEISIDTDGDVNINADGNIVLAGGGGAVARQGDPVAVDDPDSGTLIGTITGGSDDVESG